MKIARVTALVSAVVVAAACAGMPAMASSSRSAASPLAAFERQWPAALAQLGQHRLVHGRDNYTTENTVTDPQAVDGDGFGSAVAVDGSLAVVGARTAVGGTGSAYVYSYDAGPSTWQYVGPAEYAPDDQAWGIGTSVAISGTTMAVSAPALGQSFTGGQVTLWSYSSGTLTREQTIIDPAATVGDGFGAQVLFAGGHLVISALGPGGGVVYVYTLDSGTWTVTDTLTDPAQTAGDEFGAAMASDGPNFGVGAPGTDSASGAAYIYAWNDGQPAQTPDFTGQLQGQSQAFGPGARLGQSMAAAVLTGEGDFFAIGAPGADTTETTGGGGPNGGAVVAIVHSNGWGFMPSGFWGSANDGVGVAVAMNPTSLAIGAYGSNIGSGVSILSLNDGNESISAPQSDELGSALAADPATIVVGSPGASGGGDAMFIADAPAVATTLTVSAPANANTVDPAVASIQVSPAASGFVQATDAAAGGAQVGTAWVDSSGAGPIDLDLPTVGSHHVTFTFTPSDATSYESSTTSETFTVADAPGSIAMIFPQRIADTRSGLGGHQGAIASRGVLSVPIEGTNDEQEAIPNSGVGSLIVNVTTIASAGSVGTVSAYADGSARVSAPILALHGMGQVASSRAVVRMGSDHRIDISNDTSGPINIVVDVVGFTFSGTPGAGGLTVLTRPLTVLDTLAGIGHNGALAANVPVTFPVGGVGGIPPTAAAVIGSLCALNPTRAGAARLVSSTVSAPTITSLSYNPSETCSSVVAALAGGSPRLSLSSSTASHYTFTVSGYWSAGRLPGGLYETVPPTLERTITSIAGHANVAVTLPGSYLADVLTITESGATSAGFLAVFPQGDMGTPTSDVNFVGHGNPVSNLLFALGGDDQTYYIYNSSSSPVRVTLQETGLISPTGSVLCRVASAPHC